MIKIFLFVIIWWLIFSSLAYVWMLNWLKEIIININSNFFPFLPWEIKAIFSIIVVIVAYRFYRNLTH